MGVDPATKVPRTRVGLGHTPVQVSRWCLGCNPFGWTVDTPGAAAILDRYLDAGGNFIDTADSYPPGSAGGKSEVLIGAWIKARGTRDHVVLATKVGAPRAGETSVDLTPTSIRRRAEASLRRLGVDHVDILYAHLDDRATPLEDTLGALDALVRAGLVGQLGASNYSAPRLQEALELARQHGWTPFTVLQTHYNLLERTRIIGARSATSEVYEPDLSELCERAGIAVIPYWALAKGFLTGKYRDTSVDGPAFSDRAAIHRPHEYLRYGGKPVIELLEQIAREHGCTSAAVAMGWTLHQPAVVSAVASVRTPAQLDDLAAVFRLVLSDDELRALDAVTTAADDTSHSHL